MLGLIDVVVDHVVVDCLCVPVPILEESVHEPGPPLPGPGVELVTGVQVTHHLTHHGHQALVHCNLEQHKLKQHQSGYMIATSTNSVLYVSCVIHGNVSYTLATK